MFIVSLQIHSREYKCPDCPKSFYDLRKLTFHRRLHTDEKPYECDICQKTFKISSSLTNHRRVHSEEKPFVCSFCRKPFSRSQNLVRHMRIHTGEKPFPCRYAEMRGALCARMRKRGSEFVYVCIHFLARNPSWGYFQGHRFLTSEFREVS